MKKSIQLLSILALLVLGVSAAQAARYWDINGSSSGASGTNPASSATTPPTATWTSTATFWTPSVSGTAADHVAWTADEDALFSAGTGDSQLTGAGTAYTVTVSGFAPSINSITFRNGAPLITGSTITMSGPNITTTPSRDPNNLGDSTIASVIAGSAGLTKLGSGTLILTAANSYSGTTLVSVGRLRLTGSGNFGNSSIISIGSDGVLDVTAVAPYAITSGKTLDGDAATGTLEGSVTLNSGALLTMNYLSGSPTIDVASGTLTLNDNDVTVTVTGSQLGPDTYVLISKSGSGTVAGTVGGTLTVDGLGYDGDSASLSIVSGQLVLTIVGATTTVHWSVGDGDWDTTTQNWKAGAETTNYVDGVPVEFTDVDATGDPTVTLDETVQPESVTVFSTKHYTLTGSGAIDGTTTLSKLGSGTLTLSLTNSYTGGTTLTAGRLNIGTASALGDASGTFTIEGGTIDNTSGGALTLDNYPQAWDGNFTFAGTDDLNLGSGAVTMSATRTVTASAANLTVGGVIDGASTGLTKAGAGTLTLSGNNTFTGGLTISEGHVVLDNAGALNSTTPNGVSITDAAATRRLSLNGNDLTVPSLTQAGFAGVFTAIVDNGHASTDVTLTLDLTSGSSTYIGVLTNGGAASLAFTKTGSGTLVYGGGGAGAMRHTGDTTISAGMLRAGANNLLPFGAGYGNVIIATNATFDIQTRSAMTINGLSGSGTINRSDPGGAPNCTLTLGDNNATSTFEGVIQTTHASAYMVLVKTGTGTVTLTGDNTYRPFTNSLNPNQILAGTLEVGNGGTTGSIPSTNTLVETGANLTFNRSDAVTYSGSTSGAITGGGTVTKKGAGTLTLNSSANDYSGGTIISAGAVLWGSATALGTGTVTLNDTETDANDTGLIRNAAGTLTNSIVVANEGSGTVTIGNDTGNTSVIYSGSLTLNRSVTLKGGGASGIATFSGSASGAGGVTITANAAGGKVRFSTAKGYSGDTSIAADGTLELTGTGSINSSPNITINSGGTFNVSAVAPYSLASGQTLNGEGDIVGALVVASGAAISPGTSIGTLTSDSSVTLAGDTDMEINKAAGPTLTSDKLVLTGGTLTYGGNLNVSASGDALSGGEVFDLFDAPAFSASFGNLNLPSLPVADPALNWYTDNLGTDGTIIVNRAPVASAAPYTRAKGTSLKISIADLLTASTADADGNARSLTAINTPTAPSAGSASISGGYILYSPSSDANDSFSYAISDGRGGASTNTVSITVVDSIGAISITGYDQTNITLRFYGIPGYNYVVQRGSNVYFTNFIDELVTNAAAANGLFEYTDTTPPYSPAFYRVRSE